MNETKKYIFFLLFWIPLTLFSQPFPSPQNDYFSKFIHYTTDNGLSDSRILDIIQDEKGYIWLATENGLNKFDGYTFKNYFPGNFVSIPDKVVIDLETDQFGTLWIGTSNGLCYYNRETDQFYTIGINEPDSLTFPDQSIRKLMADHEGSLWIETKQGYLIQMNILSGKFEYWKHKQIDQEYYRYHTLFQDKNKNIWCGGRSSGPYFFDRKTHKFQLLPISKTDSSKKREIDTGAIFEDSRNNFWISALDGIYLYEREKNTFSKEFGTSTYQIIEDRKNRLWLATGNGLFRYDFGKNEFVHFLANPDVPNGLNDNHVHCVFEDKAGNIWVGTNEGVNLYITQNEMMTHITHISGVENSLTSNDIVCAMQDFDGEIWLGTKEHGINRVDPEFQNMPIRSNGEEMNFMASDRISDIYQTKDSAVWIGLWSGHGFYHYNKKTGKSKRIAQMYNARTHDWYNDFLEGLDNDLWVASWGGYGLIRVNQKSYSIFPDRMEDVRTAVPSRLITCLLESDSGKLVVGTYDQGFCIYDFKNETSLIFKDGFPDSTKLWGNKINVLKYGKQGEIWIAANGLNRFDTKTKTFTHYFVGSNFANLEINSIITGENNLLWLGTNQGILVFNALTSKYTRLNKSNVLPFNQFSKAAIQLQNNKFLFAGKGGAIIFNPELVLKAERTDVNPVITQISEFEKVLFQDATVTDNFKFNYKQNDLTIHFSSLYFYGNNSLQYEYKLINYHDEWISTQLNQNVINISNIPPGNYEFLVRLKGDNWPASKYKFEIKPAFWQTTWFLLAIIITVISLIALYLWLQRRRLVAEKNALISKQKLLRTQMNPHFIFNSLMAIQHFLLRQDSGTAAIYLGKFSKLMRGILSHSKEETITLEKEIEFLDNYLRLQKLRFEESFEYSFNVDENLQLELIKIPPMLTQPFIENAIEHGIKESCGKVQVTVFGDDNFLKMVVEDNGVGYLNSVENRAKFQNHESMAINITSERLKLLHKKQKNNITFEITDLSREGGKGTRVLFKIPLNL